MKKLSQNKRLQIQLSSASVRKLAKRYKVNPKTIVKWKSRDSTNDLHRKTNRSHKLSAKQAQIIKNVREKYQLSLNELIIVFKDALPNISRSTFYRCLKAHDSKRLAKRNLTQPRNLPTVGNFKTEMDCWHPPGHRVLYHYKISDAVTEFTFKYPWVGKRTDEMALHLLQSLISTVPYKINILMTDGTEWFFGYARTIKKSAPLVPFERECKRLGIEIVHGNFFPS